jgi:2-dehydro-3-deoxygluconokinase
MVEMASTGGGNFRLGFAGDTFNTAWYAKRALGPDWTVGYFTAVGDDTISSRMLAFMTDQGIDTTQVLSIKGRKPGLYLIELNDGERSFSYWRDTSAARSLADDATALESAINDADAVYFSGITLAILPPEARTRLLSVLAKAKARGALIGFDSNIRLHLWKDMAELREAIRAAAKVATLALPTVPDELDVFGETDATAVAQRYRDHGVAETVVKAGADPALVVWPDGRCLVSSNAQAKPIDTTGAGDSFNGTYIAARLVGNDPKMAARKAHATAGRVIQAYGALV